MLRALIGFLCVCFSIPSQAKLGEAVPQLIKRFGKSYTIESVAIGKTYKFRSEKVSVDVLVANGLSVAETYFSDHPLTASGEPPNDIVRAVLKTNVPQARWIEIDAVPFRADYALQSSDHGYIAVLRYKQPQPENSVWTMTVGRTKVVGSISTASPSPASAVTTPPATLAPTPAISAAPVIIASPKPVPHIDFSPEQFTPSPRLKTLEPLASVVIGYLTRIALFVGAAIFYVVALAKAFRRKTARWIVAAVVGALLLGSMFVVLTAELRNRVSQQPQFANQPGVMRSFKFPSAGFSSSTASAPSISLQVTATPAAAWTPPDKPLGEIDLPALVKIIRPAVVQIIGYKNGKIVQTGSGFIAEDGAVVTNFHVIDGIDDAYIKLSNGSQKHVLGLAHYSEGADIAILLVLEVDGIRGLSFSSSLPEVGERIYVLGNPETFTGTLSDGLVSARRRDDYGALVQISAPISHGSSGSPVFDNGGLVVGVAMASVESGQSLNFARGAGAVRAMLLSEQGFTTFGNLNKAQVEKERATVASDPDYIAAKQANQRKDYADEVLYLASVFKKHPNVKHVRELLSYAMARQSLKFAIAGDNKSAVEICRAAVEIDDNEFTRKTLRILLSNP